MIGKIGRSVTRASVDQLRGRADAEGRVVVARRMAQARINARLLCTTGDADGMIFTPVSNPEACAAAIVADGARGASEVAGGTGFIVSGA